MTDGKLIIIMESTVREVSNNAECTRRSYIICTPDNIPTEKEFRDIEQSAMNEDENILHIKTTVINPYWFDSADKSMKLGYSGYRTSPVIEVSELRDFLCVPKL